MSEFDKEAERERLREKYEQDQAEREATQRMSDLLLKGARMTSTHCGTCGDPLFEQEGTTFCPSCHGGPEGVDASLEVEEPDSGEARTEDAPSPEPQPDRSVEPRRATRESPQSHSSTGSAEANLQRALERFAAAAASEEDPRRAREHLAAAREAAEALAALR